MIMNKKLRNRIILIASVIFVVVLAVCITLFIKKKNADKTVNVAFYGLQEDYINLIKDSINEAEEVKSKELIVNFTVLAGDKFEPSVVSSKYDMLFTWQGEFTSILSDSAEDIPSKVLENIPVSLRDKKCLPLLLDHWELDFNKDTVSKTGIVPYDNIESFRNYLYEAKGYVFLPFFMAGISDRGLLAFITSFVEAQGGIKAYENLINTLKENEDLNNILDVELDSDLTLRTVLDEIKKWPSEGLTHPSWFSGNENDLVIFTEENHVGAFYTNLSTHRKYAYKNISKFDTTRFPRTAANIDHGIIAPAVSVMLLSNNSNSKKFVKDLMSESAQTKMSTKTMLAPVHYRAECYDVQADDVRFWAASCAGGALPDPYLAVYQKKADSLTKIVNEIRLYLKR